MEVEVRNGLACLRADVRHDAKALPLVPRVARHSGRREPEQPDESRIASLGEGSDVLARDDEHVQRGAWVHVGEGDDVVVPMSLLSSPAAILQKTQSRSRTHPR
jgi:hypothetical protein